MNFKPATLNWAAPKECLAFTANDEGHSTSFSPYARSGGTYKNHRPCTPTSTREQDAYKRTKDKHRTALKTSKKSLPPTENPAMAVKNHHHLPLIC
ncbi:MAG: hypothetical protein PHH59_07190 [Methylovulum sp.]|uniref:hypothetical protein n=1 Tax=Methylovulum sp. TaxID=1916980 RepID=UPI0026270823|nr:hypothetical protein [Methylovulum sp.]MDD2723792.1 hypothetical protein [Methylovulum sp.]MDD5123649.1 hypothetical protein [Methylovulum sp.]